MAMDANSRIATAVHPLEGSTPPGAGDHDRLRASHADKAWPKLSDVDQQRAAVMRLAKLHGLDTEVIELAERVERLAKREQRLWARTSSIEDAASAAMPPRPKRIDGSSRITTEFATAEDGGRVTTIHEPFGWAAETQAYREAHEASLAAWERHREAEEARLGLPFWSRLRDRAGARLGRWGLRLTDAQPRTEAGVAAKAAASLAVGEQGALLDPWRQQLASSLGRDAIRVIVSTADDRFLEDQARDGELFSLIARHGPASKAWDDADEAATPFGMAWWEARPPMPATLRRRMTDYPFEASGREQIEGSKSHFAVFIESDIEVLRSAPAPVSKVEHREPAPWNSDETIVRIERFPDATKIARKAEILDTWDAWQAEIDRLRETTGLNAANAVVEGAAQRTNKIEDAILDYQPRTFEGLQAKARWIASMPCSDERAQHLLRDLCRMPPITLSPPVQVAPSRDVVETYRAFLDMEFRFLNWETHGTADASGGIWLDNPAGRLHGSGQPAPSSRAIAVLTTLGLMPNSTAEDKRIAESEAA